MAGPDDMYKFVEIININSKTTMRDVLSIGQNKFSRMGWNHL